MISVTRMASGLSPIALAFALSATPLSAQEEQAQPEVETEEKAPVPQDETLEPLPIIVSGETEDKRQVIVGSRIPKESLFAEDQIASDTSMNGLTPGSGMTPYSNRTINKIIRSCKASDEDISNEAACRLLSARRAMDDADWLTVRGLLVPLARDEEAETKERRAAADYLLEASGLAGGMPARREALGLLLDTNTLAPQDAAKVHRNLADMARQAGDMDEARGHLEASLTHDPAAPQTLANLAVLEREAGLASASATMTRAIAAMEEGGGTVPESWRQFAAQSPEDARAFPGAFLHEASRLSLGEWNARHSS